MRLVNWEELRTLPEGTIIQRFRNVNGTLDEPTVFGGALSENDYVEATLLPQVTNGDLIYYPAGFGRYGLYDLQDGHQWLVWEEEDRKRMAEWLLDPAACAAAQNDEPFATVPCVS